jgi:hypothetical protein
MNSGREHAVGEIDPVASCRSCGRSARRIGGAEPRAGRRVRRARSRTRLSAWTTTTFYAVDNQTIGKYEKKTGKLVKKWIGDKKGPILPP